MMMSPVFYLLQQPVTNVQRMWFVLMWSLLLALVVAVFFWLVRWLRHRLGFSGPKRRPLGELPDAWTESAKRIQLDQNEERDS